MRAILVLNAKVGAIASIVSSVPNQLREVSSTIVETKGAIENLTRYISEEFAYLPTRLNKMLEGTLRRVIQISVTTDSQMPIALVHANCPELF
jgi:hypothetical protein